LRHSVILSIHQQERCRFRLVHAVFAAHRMNEYVEGGCTGPLILHLGTKWR
jgi:hypothetical protein